jgi:hypothetical protein
MEVKINSDQRHWFDKGYCIKDNVTFFFLNTEDYAGNTDEVRNNYSPEQFFAVGY